MVIWILCFLGKFLVCLNWSVGFLFDKNLCVLGLNLILVFCLFYDIWSWFIGLIIFVKMCCLEFVSLCIYMGKYLFVYF